jgi:hypothetical protein
MNQPARLLALIAAAAVLALGLIACGDDDDATSATTTPAQQDPGGMQSAQMLSLTGESTTLVLDRGTAKVLSENKVTVAPVMPAAPLGGGIAFPITGGRVDSESLAGTIEHSGGLTFSAGGEKVVLTDFVVNTSAGTLASMAAGAELPTLELDLTELERSTEGGAIVASGITAALSPEAATALNDAFGVSLFEAGLPIGTVTVRATA